MNHKKQKPKKVGTRVNMDKDLVKYAKRANGEEIGHIIFKEIGRAHV